MQPPRPPPGRPCGNLGIGKSRILEPGNLEMWDPKKVQKIKFSKSKSVLPKMSARFFHAGKKRPRPIWGHLGTFFAWAGKIQKLPKFSLFSLVSQWANSANRFESADPAVRYGAATTPKIPSASRMQSAPARPPVCKSWNLKTTQFKQ